MTDDLIRRGDAIAKIKERASGKSSSGLVLTVDAAIDALAALPRSSSQRSKERAMTDDKELIAMARLAQRDERMSTGALYGDLADRIEALLEQCEGLAQVVDYNWVTHQRVIAAEAKLAEAVKALEYIKRYSSCGDTRRKAIETLAEIKGGNDAKSDL